MKIFIPDSNFKTEDENVFARHRTPIKEALEVITDDWILSGNYADQTIIDMRNCLKKLIKCDE